MRLNLPLSALLLSLSFVAAAHADTLDYSYSSTDGYGDSFTFDFQIPSAISPTQVFTANSGSVQLTDIAVTEGGSVLPDSSVSISEQTITIPNQTLNTPSDESLITTDDAGENGVFGTGIFSLSTMIFESPKGACTGAGSYLFQGTLTVTDLTPAAVTPEPGGLVLLGTGAFALAGELRRRIAKR